MRVESYTGSNLNRAAAGCHPASMAERNARFFEDEADKLDGWADDLKLGLEREIKELDRQIREARRAATTALTLEEKLTGQRQIKALEAQRNQKRRTLFDAQDEVDKQRDELREYRGQTGANSSFSTSFHNQVVLGLGALEAPGALLHSKTENRVIAGLIK